MVPCLDPTALSSSARGPDGGGAHGRAAAAAAPWLRARGLRVVAKFGGLEVCMEKGAKSPTVSRSNDLIC